MTDIAGSKNIIQVEATRTRAPVSESLAQSMGASINYLLEIVLPVGSIIDSMLTESQFQAETSTNWILADGRSVVGSRYQTITGSSTVPDARAYYRRAKDNGAGRDSHGDLPLGTTYPGQIESHTHAFGWHFVLGSFSSFNTTSAPPDGNVNSPTNPTRNVTHITDPTGLAETNPVTLVINTFIRIN